MKSYTNRPTFASAKLNFKFDVAIDKINQALAVITAVIVMDHDDGGFTQQSVEREVFDPLPRISAGKDRKGAVAHNGNVPHLGKKYGAPVRIGRNNVIIHRGDKIGVL